MGKVKGYVSDICDNLGISFDEVCNMSIVELDNALAQKEEQLAQATDNIEQRIDRLEQDGWDVDVDEDGPFICIAGD